MEKILEIKNLKKVFYKNKIPFTAVNDISFEMKKGECLGLVGESGCGKSTTAKLITHLIKPDGGSILINGKEILDVKGKSLKELYQDVQMVFQMPQDSFDPRRSLGDGIMESMRNRGMKKAEARERMMELLRMVELEPEYAKRYPHEVSGGQCQRAAIARALSVEPKLIICDEATSALDVTVQAQIVELLGRLQREMGLSILLICHDLALVQALCDRVLVMYKGSIVEEGIPDEVIGSPKKAYTKVLIESVF
ncbi:MAG: dipeptide/oligopeptide/nickel ABC transporter ATP-binding protein [Hominisplanchenecus sp.]|nr:dipeptide/oligopeptide/nickel ABC transporter ATP-binding protein [Lachnospiraceae bacterium]MDY2819392.1 dipeptide/oligopeptide/nickel ABC transporter ATP-binding protein [Hominisplanchenecus sp.]